MYFELLNLLLEVSEKDNTLNSNNFKTIIVNIDIQEIVVKSFLKLNCNSEQILIDTMYKDFLNIQNQKSYGGFYSGIRFSI